MNNLGYLIKSVIILVLLQLISFNIPGQDNKGNAIPHFLFPAFVEGKVVMKDGKSFSSKLNYNMADEEMVTELNGVYRSANKPDLFDTIYIEGHTFVPIGKTFYEILTNGPACFFIQNKCQLVPRGNPTGYGNQNQAVGPTKMKRYEVTSVNSPMHDVVYIDLPQDVDISPASVYWVRTNNKMEKFNTEKQFLKIFPGKATQLKEYIKKEDISLKKRADIIKLGLYCNEIMK